MIKMPLSSQLIVSFISDAFQFLSYIFGCLGGYLILRRNSEDRFKNWLINTNQNLANSYWLELPPEIVRLLIKIVKLPGTLTMYWSKGVISDVPLLCWVAVATILGLTFGNDEVGLTIFFITFALYFLAIKFGIQNELLKMPHFPFFIVVLPFYFAILVFPAATLILILRLNLMPSLVISWIGSFFIFIMLCGGIVLLEEKTQRIASSLVYIFSLFWGISISFGITILSIIIGLQFTPLAWVPKTLSILISNLLFDGLTFVTTVFLLSRAVKLDSGWYLVFAVLWDLFLAALFAIGSLYLGLMGSEHSITISQAINVLIGLSSFGLHYDFGPFFWIMHTAFLPTLSFLLIVLLAIIIKAIVSFVQMILSNFSQLSNPISNAEGVCVILVSVLQAISFALEYLEFK